jgi:hypothetical protein
METNFNSVPRRAIYKKSILHFAFCNFLQYYQLSSLQGAKKRSCILHFAFFCEHAILQKLSANSKILQFAKSFCIFSQLGGTENGRLAPTCADLRRLAPTCADLRRPAPTCADLRRFAPTKKFFFLPWTKVVACFGYTAELISTQIVEKLF